MSGHLLIVGASGMVGTNALRHFVGLGDWDVTAIGRRPPAACVGARFLAADLADSESLHSISQAFAGVTHVLYAANYEKQRLVSGWLDSDHVERNFRMFANLMATLEPTAQNLKHVTLMQGTKAYGAAAGAIRLPARESDHRSLAPNFYYLQEDHLKALRAGKCWTYTVLRPQWVCGFTLGGSMNGMAALGTYAAICRETGAPFSFPGGPPRVNEATDVRLLAKAIEWAGRSDAAADEAFNVVNGDVFDWHTVWPRIARAFDVEWEPPNELRLAKIMVDKAPLWERIVLKYGLKSHRLDELVPSWEFADKLFGYRVPPTPMLLSGLKIRRAGFEACQDSEDMILDWLRIMQSDRTIPN